MMRFQMVALVVALIMSSIALSGCLTSAADPEECEENPQTEYWDAWSHVWAKWAEDIDEESPVEDDHQQLLGVMALRFSDPEELPKDEFVQISTYVDWRDYPIDERPELLHDLLCFSKWRVENFPNMIKESFYTTGATTRGLAHSAMADLELEHERQNGFNESWCCYIFFQGEFYGAKLQYTTGHHH